MSNESDIATAAINKIRECSNIPNMIIATGDFFNHLLNTNKYDKKEVYQWIGKK